VNCWFLPEENTSGTMINLKTTTAMINLKTTTERDHNQFKNNYRNVKRFRGGLVFQAHRHLYHSTLGLKVMKKKKKLLPISVKCWFLPEENMSGIRRQGCRGRRPRKNNHSTEICSGSEAGSYLRLIDSCATQLKDLLGPATRVNKEKKRNSYLSE